MWEKRTGNTHAEIKISINNINQYITHHELESKNKSVNGHLKHLIFSQKFQILATGSKLENCGSSRSKVCGPTLN